ncbi:hypothetical protein OROGR_033124 [Orobanche gracilis]
MLEALNSYSLVIGFNLSNRALFASDSEIQALVDVKAEESKKNPDCFGVFCLTYDVKASTVVEKPAPVKISPLLTSRHLSQRRLRLPVRKYHPKTDGLKVAFFNDDEETPSTPKAYALFVPRENPIALVIRPLEQWHSRSGMAKTMANGTPVHENGKERERKLLSFANLVGKHHGEIVALVIGTMRSLMNCLLK